MEPNKDQALYIKNMVCPRCIQSVLKEATKARLNVREIKLGEIVLSESYTESQLNQFQSGIEKHGFKLITDRRARIAEAIKTEIINVIQYGKKVPGHQNFSTYLASLTGMDYSYLSSLFSSTEKITIEKYIILQKVEKTKEHLSYDELSLGEIAVQLGYSSTQHLSSQFKKITGLSPSQFKNLKEKNRRPIDQVGNDHPPDGVV